MRVIDLNADLGEGGSHDADLMALVSSVNIACGGHAGDETTMEDTVEEALAAGVAIGAHPGYEDRAHFGRRPLDLEPTVVMDLVFRQVGRLAEIAAGIHHVKPHGALYHQADRDPALAAAIAEGVKRIVPGCGFFAPPGGALSAAAEAAGLPFRPEGFVDRRYRANGSLVPRSEADAVIEDLGEAVAQALTIACEGRVKTVSGTWFPLPAETLCVHGDGKRAVEMLEAVRSALEDTGFTIQAS